MIDKNIPEIVIIFWTDASMHGTTQRSVEECKELGLIDGIASGIKVHEDKKQITIALDYFPVDKQFRQIASYPKSGIKQIIRKKLIKENK